MARRTLIEAVQSWPKKSVRMAAAIVGAVQVAFVTFAISTSGYFRDDFPFFNQARQGGFGGSQLTRSVFGSLVPGFQLGNSVLASFSPIPRWPAIVVPALLYALALLVFYRLAELLFGPRPVVILFMGIAGSSGVLAISLVWWTAGLNSLPAVVCDLVALDGLVRHRVTGRSRHLVIAAVAFAIGVAFYDASASFLVVMALVTALFLARARTPRAIVEEFVGQWWIWVALLAPIVLNFVWREAHHAEYALPPLPSIPNVFRFVGAGWAQGFVPTSFGLDFDRLSSSDLRVLVVVLGQCLVIGLAAFSIRRRRDAWRAWAVFVGGFVAIEAVAAIGRGYAGTEFALNTVYWAVQPFVLLLCVGLAFLPTHLMSEPAPAKPKRGVRPPAAPDVRVVSGLLVVTVVLVVVGGLFIWNAKDRQQGSAARSYIDTLSASWRQVQAEQPDAFVWDTQVPPFVVTPLFVPYNRVSTTAGLLMPLRVDAGHGPGYVVSATGELLPASTQVAATAVLSTPDCVASSSSPRVVTVPLRKAVPVGNWFLRLRYAHSGGFVATLGGQSVSFSRGQGTFVVPDSSPAVTRAISITIPSHASACLIAADLEAPSAAQQGPA